MKKGPFFTQSWQILIDLVQIKLGQNILGTMALIPQQIPSHFTVPAVTLAIPDLSLCVRSPSLSLSLCVRIPLRLSLSLSLCVTTNSEPDHGPPASTI